MTVSLRARFALACGLLVVVVAATVAAGGYLALRASLVREARRSADAMAAQLAGVVDTGGRERAVEGRGAQQGNYVDLRDPSLVGQFVRPGLWVVVVGPDARVVRSSFGAPGRLLSARLITECRNGGSAHARARHPDAVVGCRRVWTRRDPTGFIVAAVPLAGADRTLRAARHALIAGVLAGALASVILAWLLARRALAPIGRIAAAAQSIRRGDLSRRIGYGGGRDELAQLAAELDASFAELEGALRRQERFVADASHELKTPLAAARANVQLLRRWASQEPQAREQALGALERSTSRMARIVADLLQLARGDASLDVAREPVRLDDVVLEASREVRALTADVELTIERVEQALVVGDRERLQQLLANLLDNALRVTPTGGHVQVALWRDGDHVNLSVTDGGPGIPADELPHVFERFYRGRAAPPGEGSGLGLAIARMIARAHGGDIHVRTQAGVGSTFTVVLPAEQSSPNRHLRLTGGSSGGDSLAAQSTSQEE